MEDENKTKELEAKLAKALESISKLEAKNSELISEKQKAKDAADAAESERDAAEEEKARTSNDLKALEEKLTAKHAKEMAKIAKENEGYRSQLNTLLIDNSISAAMDAHNVLPQFKKAVTAMIKAEAKLDNGEAMAGGMALTDYISQFVTSDDGKHFVSAPANSGGMVTNVNPASSVAHGYTKDNFNSRVGEWMMLAKTDPAQAKAIAIEVGKADLANDL
ncbi:hypothetical protein [Novosphingobium sp. EMRT-2]|uniref:hypothetical protein n=1 Tax=Novosphingobium sp. EMRT-2 TaxID=2571749 RepID=UPI0010BDA628|nr:hypothetical protein [Novosphingobium sp. EMRT-2]QCI92594.1 hypothetical protein FA702_02840 [Novosphingobium sp. EMRT-2]